MLLVFFEIHTQTFKSARLQRAQHALSNLSAKTVTVFVFKPDSLSREISLSTNLISIEF